MKKQAIMAALAAASLATCADVAQMNCALYGYKIGGNKGDPVVAATNTVVIGAAALAHSPGAANGDVLLGNVAATFATNVQHSVGIGAGTLVAASNVISSISIGPDSGREWRNVTLSSSVGSGALYAAKESTNCVAVGTGALSYASGVKDVVAIGTFAGHEITNVTDTVLIGNHAGVEHLTGYSGVNVGNVLLGDTGSAAIQSYRLCVGDIDAGEKVEDLEDDTAKWQPGTVACGQLFLTEREPNAHTNLCSAVLYVTNGELHVMIGDADYKVALQPAQ